MGVVVSWKKMKLQSKRLQDILRKEAIEVNHGKNTEMTELKKAI